MDKELVRYVDSLLEYEQNKRVGRLAEIFKQMLSRDLLASQDENLFYEKLLNPSQEVLFSQSVMDRKSNECAGTYYVNGYTRSDGIEVEGYMRTCGAAHEGNADVKTGDSDTQDNKVSQSANFERPVSGKIRSEFGYRVAPTVGASSNHSGWDLEAPIGTPIKAITDGKVICANSNGGNYGNWILLDHGKINDKNVTSEYGHISKWVVSPGQQVKKGQIIGYTGNSGVSTGPHLHITIKNNGIPVDPGKYILRN